MSDTTESHRRGVDQYSSDTLEIIARDLAKNHLSTRKGTWEIGRLAAIKNELKKRRKEKA